MARYKMPCGFRLRKGYRSRHILMIGGGRYEMLFEGAGRGNGRVVHEDGLTGDANAADVLDWIHYTIERARAEGGVE